MQRSKKLYIALACVVLAAVVTAGFAVSSRGGGQTPAKKMVILGFDGVDPDLLREFMAQGKLPNIQKLAESGSLMDLGTSYPPESPVAWATFDIGTNPGQHGIFDFLSRDPRTYFPTIGGTEKEDAQFTAKQELKSPPKVINLCQGEPFWKTAADAGVKVVNLFAPIGFPPVNLGPDGYMLSGLNTPDLRGTQASYQFLSTDTLLEKPDEVRPGGKVTEITEVDGKIATVLYGPWDPWVRQQRRELKEKIDALRAGSDATSSAVLEQIASAKRDQERLDERKYATVPLTIDVDRENKSATFHLQGQDQTVREGQWGTWLNVSFTITANYAMKGIVKFLPVEIGRDIKIYVSPIEMDPRDPYLEVSYPPEFSKELAEKVGLFKVRGWAAETAALKDERIDEAAFMSDLDEIFDMREKIALYTLENKQWDLFIWLESCTDRIAHMFYRLIDPGHPIYDAELAAKYGMGVLRYYERMDQSIAKIMEKLPPDTPVICISDHGFHSYRTGVNINTWLVENGFMVLKGQVPGQPVPDELWTSDDFLRNVDWTRTRAYALGLGLIFVNLEGRERNGIVKPGEEYDQLCREIVTKLKELKDPETGLAASGNAFIGKEIYRGAMMKDAPDVVTGFAPFYRVSWHTALGGVPKGVFEKNDQKWSGDHCSDDPAQTKGFILSTRKISKADPDLLDLSATVLTYYGLPVKPPVEGKDLFTP